MIKDNDRNAKTAFTDSVNALINKKDVNNKQFADICGIKPDRLSKLLSPSNTASPKGGELLTVSEALDVSCDYLIGRATDPSGISDKDLINKLVEHFSLPLWFQILAALKDKGLIDIEKVDNKTVVRFGSDSLNACLVYFTSIADQSANLEFGNDAGGLDGGFLINNAYKGCIDYLSGKTLDRDYSNLDYDPPTDFELGELPPIGSSSEA